MHKIKLAIVDDHKILREGIKASLINKIDIDIVFEAENGEDFLEKLKYQIIDVVLLDIKMPKIDGIEVLKTIKNLDSDIKVIILTMFDTESYVLKLMDLKANGYLLKNSDPQEIYNAIKNSVDFGYYFPDFVKNLLLKRTVSQKKINPKNNENLIEFTQKEVDIIRLISEQKTSAQIGKEMFLSPRTIDGIKAKLIERTKVDNTIGLIVYCYKHGILL
ncbi:MAG: response regulator transcription factor [Saprospiraceae bacterium]|nr:response regulator transcription factor [Candidatus Defluviibacterium haderslevense]MBK7243857.1 response regulator transcription factor [Candidatus Defluviibacterium haderslevense]